MNQDTQGAEDDWAHVQRLAARLGGRFVLNSDTRAATQGEPAAWLYDVDGWSHREVRLNAKRPLPDGWTEMPLYRHPPAPQPVQNLHELDREAIARIVKGARLSAAFGSEFRAGDGRLDHVDLDAADAIIAALSAETGER